MDQKYIDVPFGQSGDQTAIADATQTDGTVSFTQGWGQDYALDPATNANAKDIDRATMNYLFYVLSQAIQQYQQVGFPEWITPTNNGGTAFAYSKGTVVRYRASTSASFVAYVNTVDGNTAVPGADSTWQLYSILFSTLAQATANDANSVLTPAIAAQVYAALGGLATQTFNVKTAVAGTNNAVPINQADARYAALAGLATQTFSVGTATTGAMAPQAMQVAPSLGGSPRMTASAALAATTATFTDDYVNVASALTGATYRIPSFAATLNLSTTGIGGMDTGTATASGSVAVYAAFSPTIYAAQLAAGSTVAVALAAASGVFGQVVTAAPPVIYGGANAPSGYTATGLISILQISSTAGQFAGATQHGRRIDIPGVLAASTTSPPTSLTAVPLAGMIPYGARRVFGRAGTASATSALANSFVVAPDTSTIGTIIVSGYSASGGGWNTPIDAGITVQRTIYWYSTASSGATFNLAVTGYEV